MKTVQNKDNLLFNRKEIKVIVDAEKNPSFPEAEKIISEEFKTSPGTVYVKGIKGKFGRNTFLIRANIYKTQEDKERTEPDSKKRVSETKLSEGAGLVESNLQPAEEKTESVEENK